MEYICYTMGMTLRCIALAGGVPDLDFRTQRVYEAPRYTISIADRERVYREMGMVSTKEFFCRGKVHSMDARMCAQ